MNRTGFIQGSSLIEGLLGGMALMWNGALREEFDSIFHNFFTIMENIFIFGGGLGTGL